MNLRAKYLMLFDRATSPRSVDLGHRLIYKFDRYCKRCRAGLTKPAIHDRRYLKGLYSKGYCTERCLDKGPTLTRYVNARVSQSHSRMNKFHIIEHSALTALIYSRFEKRLSPMQRLVLTAERTCRVLSAKLRYLEVHSGMKFYANKFYRILNKMEALL